VSGALIGEALDVLFVACRALLAWIAAAAFAATVVLFTTVLAVAQGWKATRRALRGPSWRRGRLRARIHARRHRKRHSEPTDTPNYQEAT
jgi:hypothetical protein